MNLQKRIKLLAELLKYLEENGKEWQVVKAQASLHNGWFIPDFIDLAIQNICREFLKKEKLEQWIAYYHLDDNVGGKNVGLVMAGNIPMVGFHDFLSVFISGHRQKIKLSSKDDILFKHLVQKMAEWDESMPDFVSFAEMLKGCDAYIATGTNNSAKYFKYYFSKYPHIIRRNRTGVAVLTGNESSEDLNKLSDDIHIYFGLGCRNVTKILVPREYDFIPLLKAFDRYAYFADHHKYKNNYDYQLSIALLNNIYYMTNGSTLLIEEEGIFSPISRVNYSFYTDQAKLISSLQKEPDIQCIAGSGWIPFGLTQKPSLTDYADGADTMQFLLAL